MASATRKRLLKFKGPKVIKSQEVARAKAMRIVAAEQEAALRKKLGPNTPVVSRPYASPNSKTGALRNNTTVMFKSGKNVVRTFQYGFWLEGGTSRVKPRPWIINTMNQKRWVKKIVALTKKFSKA